MLKSYEEMRKVDVKPYLEKRDGMDYLNWAMCIDLLHKNGAENVYFTPIPDPETGSSLRMTKAVFKDKNGVENRCYETRIRVVIDDQVYEMQTPVMNGANPVKDNSMSQQRVWNSMCRAFVKCVWIEEATELYEADVDILDDRLRGDLSFNPFLYYQITFSFNPVSATHWLKAKYFDIKSDDVYTHQSTYLQNRFIDEAYHRRMMMRKERDPDGYRIYGLGEWGETGGLILTNYVVEEFDTSPERFDYMVNSQDFGFNHANCIGEVGFKDGDVYLCRELYVFEKDTSEIIQMAEGKFQKRITMYCDSAEPDRIKMWQKAGYRARPVKKEPNSVKAQIDYLKQHTIHIHPSCVNTTKEIQQWKWKKDEKTNTFTDEPVNFFDDAMAMLRYSIEQERKGKVKLKTFRGGI